MVSGRLFLLARRVSSFSLLMPSLLLQVLIALVIRDRCLLPTYVPISNNCILSSISGVLHVFLFLAVVILFVPKGLGQVTYLIDLSYFQIVTGRDPRSFFNYRINSCSRNANLIHLVYSHRRFFTVKAQGNSPNDFSHRRFFTPLHLFYEKHFWAYQG